MPDLQESSTSVIYMQDKKKFTDMARYIKKLGDERVSCKVDITVDSIQLTSRLRGSQGPYAIQLVRGPLKSETSQFELDPSLETQEVALGHTFSRTTTLYRTSGSTLQKKSLLIRLLEISNNTGGEKRVAKVLSEVHLDLS